MIKKAMIRVVSRPFLGKEKYKDFRLCYVDAIPETVFGLTPESKVWQRSAEYRVIKKKLEEEVRQSIRNSIYGMDSPLINRIQSQDYPNPSFHKGKAELYAFFTEVPLSEQWGDDWDDAPYEYNAGEPYDRIFQGGIRIEHLVIKVPFYIRRDGYDIKMPEDYGYNSPFAVDDINSGAVAWIFARCLKPKCANGIAIHAGVNPYEFFKRVDRINEMYPYEPEEE